MRKVRRLPLSVKAALARNGRELPLNKEKTVFPQRAVAQDQKQTRLFGEYYLTVEQDFAVDLAVECGSLKIEAFAGAGKTSTLAAISTELNKYERKGLYLAFNKTIAMEAAENFPDNVQCSTAHAFAYKRTSSELKEKLKLGKLKPEDYVNILSISDLNDDVSSAVLLRLTRLSLNRFTQSCDDEISEKHIPKSELKGFSKDNINLLKSVVVSLVERLWKLIIDPSSIVPLGHDDYLKLWSLSKPQIRKDFILFDEAQDASGVMLAVMQCQRKAQIIYVGDRYQQIYSWRGAVNAMQTVDTPNNCEITQSFRFGQEIADIANVVLNKGLSADVAIKGFDKVLSKVYSSTQYGGEFDCILFRTNAALIDRLLALIANGKRVAVAGGCYQAASMLCGIRDLRDKGKTNHPDLIIFKSYSELKISVKEDPSSELSPYVSLAENYDLTVLIKHLYDADKVREDQADITLSTAHKSKGREWNNVLLADDFRAMNHKLHSDEEVNLLYVAVTRAIKNLDVSECEAVLELLEK
ncbi:TPA: UvrD-helicase domain-containing protein [Photobacterium damselae]